MNNKPQIMKFGGTSLGNAECIRRAARIVSEASRQRPVIAVVSAISGVTNRLLSAAHRSAKGDAQAANHLSEYLHELHETAARELLSSQDRFGKFKTEMDGIIDEAANLCHGAALLRESTPRALDSIVSVGERLSARLLAETLGEMGVASKSIDATELIVTDESFGAAEPLMPLTTEKAAARLQPLLTNGVVPVVTGFIGATVTGLLTTLGRGGSDYSATILGGSLQAEDIIIWTDVDGVMTADPRLIQEARTLPTISYNEAAELAFFGAKVLHPKTLRPVISLEIPVWIRNSFAPEQTGTKIGRNGLSTEHPVKAIAAIPAVTLVTIGGPARVGVLDIAAKTFAATAEARVPLLMISQSSSQNDICLAVAADDAERTVAALSAALAPEVAQRQVEHIQVNSSVALVAVVGEKMRGIPGISGRLFSALGKEAVNVIAIAQGSSEFNITFIVEAGTVERAVRAVHREFGLHEKTERWMKNRVAGEPRS